MDGELTRLLWLTAGAAAATILGGLVPVAVPTSNRLRGYLLHVAAGVLLAVICVELWPEIQGFDRSWPMIGGLTAGAVMMTIVNRITGSLEGGAGGLVVGAGIDSVVDGLLIGIGYAADPSVGILLVVGFAIEKFTMTMTVAAELRQDGCARRQIALRVALIGVALIPAAAAGYTLLADPSSRAHSFLLSLAAAALIYIVTMELVARGRATHTSVGTVAAFFAGFIGLAAYAVFAGV